MNIEQQQFFALLRAGLWNTPIDKTLFSGLINWDVIFKNSVRQTVLGLVAEGVSALPSEYQPSTPILNKVCSLVVLGIQSNAKINRVLVDVVAMLHHNMINTVLLKGQGVAMNYIEPMYRQCGDIDLYISQQDYRRACNLAYQWCSPGKQVVQGDKHCNFEYDGVLIEFHRIAEQLPSSKHNRCFQNWTVHHLQGDNLRTIEIEGSEIQLPPVAFDTVYIFNHIWHHFCAEGIGLRQLCDWVRYLHTFSDQINSEELERNLKSFGLWRAWRVFGYVAVDVLGLPQREFPFYNASYTCYGKKMLDIIEQEGNFGFHNSLLTKRPDGYIAGKLYRFRFLSTRLLRLFPIYVLETITIWNRFVFKGFKRIKIDDILKKQNEN